MTHVNFAMTTLLNGILEGTLLAVTMRIFLRLLPRLNSTTRFTVLWVTLLAIVVLPFGTFMPRAPIPLLQITSLPHRTIDIPTTREYDPVEKQESQPVLPKQERSSDSRKTTSKSKPLTISGESSTFSQATKGAPQTEQASHLAVRHPLIQLRSARILSALEIIWALFSAIMLMRLGVGYRKLRRLKENATPLSAEWQMRLISLREINGVRRKTQLLVSNLIAAPMSLGFLTPAILIPRTLLNTLSDSELEHVVLHELGHIWRWDDWTNLAQKLIEAVFPIQPAVYWVGNRMSIEREMACDDWVISATGTAELYAASLTKVAELSQWAPVGILTAGATGNRSQLFRRVHHMLDKTRNMAPKLTFGPLSAAIVAVGILIYAGARAPQVIAFAQVQPSEDSLMRLAPAGALRLIREPLRPIQTDVHEPPLKALTPTDTITSKIPSESTAPTFSSPAPIATVASLSPDTLIEPVEAQQSEVTHMESTTSNGWTSHSVKIDGVIEFTDDDRDVKSLSPGGHFRIVEGTFLSGRTYDVKADSTGNLTKTYTVDSREKPLDAEGRLWLGRLMPQMIRDSGVAAGPRVARILGQSGPQGVITEIGLIHSDGSKRTYLEQLFSQSTLNTEQMNEAAKLIRGISSDGDKARVLIDVDGRYFTSELRPHLFEAVESISSDGDKRRVLSDIVKKDAGSSDTLLCAARVAKHISSDGDKAEVLMEMANSYGENGGLGMAYFEAVKSISSDGDHARVLSKLLAAHGDDRDTLARVLGSAQKISSDGDKARVLKEAVSRYRDDDLIRKAFIDAANSISSDGDHKQVLLELVHKQGIGTSTTGGIAKSAQRISSDGDKARVLVELVGANIEPIRDDFFAAADTINSDGDHSHVLLAVLDKPGTSSVMAVAAIQSAAHISSDGDKGHVLLDAAHRYSKDPKVNQALRNAVEGLHSDGEYRSVMSEISKRDGNN